MKKLVRTKNGGVGGKPERTEAGKARGQRSWPVALVSAAVVVGGSILLSTVVNPLFGRSVHWDWMAVLAPTLFVLVTLSLRRRWV